MTQAVANIVILGAGVMGSALAVPAAHSPNNRVTLVGSPLDDDIVDSIQRTRAHPNLKVHIPESIHAIKLAELDNTTLAQADVIVIGVSSPGIPWVTRLLNDAAAQPSLLALVTKGLVDNTAPDQPPLTYADALPAMLKQESVALVGIGGPCIARELALGFPTRVCFASSEIHHAQRLQALLQTDYYRVTTSTHVVAVEACAALKNFLCIGVSAMISAFPLESTHAKNPLAALYNQAVLELLILSRWIAADEYAATAGSAQAHDVALDLAGMGDLHVTVGGGRNSRLGTYLGQGRLLTEVMQTSLAGVTVEGIDTGRRLSSGLKAACASGVLAEPQLPLTHAILNSIENDAPLDFDFRSLPG